MSADQAGEAQGDEHIDDAGLVFGILRRHGPIHVFTYRQILTKSKNVRHQKSPGFLPFTTRRALLTRPGRERPKADNKALLVTGRLHLIALYVTHLRYRDVLAFDDF
jgi:hypothetical protein